MFKIEVNIFGCHKGYENVYADWSCPVEGIKSLYIFKNLLLPDQIQTKKYWIQTSIIVLSLKSIAGLVR